MSCLQNGMHIERTFSLDWNDVDTTDYIASFLKNSPRRIHEAVAANPLAATRCFHWTVTFVIRTLFNCETVAGRAVDSVAAHEDPGIFLLRPCLSWCC